MRKAVMVCVLSMLLTIPANAMEFEAPRAPESVRDVVEAPADSFAAGLWNVVRKALSALDGSLSEAAGSCLTVLAAGMLCGILRQMSGEGFAMDLACTAAVAAALLRPSASLFREGEELIRTLNEYGRLLLPVMTGALAAEGGVTASAALYTATAVFNAALSAAATRLMIPVLFLFLALSAAYSAIGTDILGKMREFLRWATGWVLKLTLYLFTGFLAVTGVVSGSADAAALKAAKLTISGAVPVVGSILSDATEAVLVSAGMMKSAAGIYGLLTVGALCLTPFLRMGMQYLLLRATAALCMSFDRSRCSMLSEDFAAALGMMLALIGTQSVLLLISTVCFLKGVG